MRVRVWFWALALSCAADGGGGNDNAGGSRGEEGGGGGRAAGVGGARAGAGGSGNGAGSAAPGSGGGSGAGGSAGAEGGNARANGAGGASGGSARDGSAAGGSGGASTDAGAARGEGGVAPPPSELKCEPMGAVPNLKRTPAADKLIAGATQVMGPPDEPDTIYVLEHFTGNVRIVKAGKVLDAPLTKVSVRPNPPGREQGLLSIAFHPDFKNNKLFYLFYSAASPVGQTTVDEIKRTDSTSAMFVRNVYAKPHSHQFHNGGSIQFGKDGRLYLSIGDNQADGGPSEAQKPEGLYGRILGIDVTTKAASTWDFGLRNPYRFAFDVQTYDLYIADVGEGGPMSEKLFFSPAGTSGKNWGWRGSDNRMGVTYLDQIASNMGAIIGGFVYRGRKMPGLCGRYFYGHLNGQVYSLKVVNGMATDRRQHSELATGNLGSFGLDANGELYIGSLNGQVYRIDPAE